MSLYTFESPCASARLQSQLVLADTSSVQNLCDPAEEDHPVVLGFDQEACACGTVFLVNDTVRLEFMKLVRKSLVVSAMLALANEHPDVEHRYRAVAGMSGRRLSFRNLEANCERLLKDHAKQGDAAYLFGRLSADVWQEVQRLERQARVNYAGAPSLGAAGWDALARLMSATGIAPSDGMIVNFAFTVGAVAVVTTDCDFAPVHGALDVYMPRRIAQQCSVFDPVSDGMP